MPSRLATVALLLSLSWGGTGRAQEVGALPHGPRARGEGPPSAGAPRGDGDLGDADGAATDGAATDGVAPRAATARDASAPGAREPAPGDPSPALGPVGADALEARGEVRPYVSPTLDAHHWRAAAEMGGAMLVGTVWYIMYLDFNLPDWDLPSVESRLTLQAVRLDTNGMYTNAFGHPLMGGIYYGLARVNGLGVPESLLVSVLTSAFWEFIPEYREYVSLNDLIFTPMGGMALGEVLVHLGDYVNSAPGGGGWIHRFLSHTLGLPRSVHRALDDAPGRGSDAPPDELGFSSAYWHRFQLDFEMSGATDTRAEAGDRFYGVSLRTELVDIPDYLEPIELRGWFTQGEFTESFVRLSFLEGSLADLHVHARAVLGGWYQQMLHEHPDGEVDGWTIAAGVATGLDYRSWTVAEQHDEIGAAHLLGLAVDLRLALGRLAWLRFGAESYFDFAAVHSAAVGPYRELHGDTEGRQTILDRRSYYYAWGATAGLRAGVEYAGFELDGRLRWGGWWGIDAMDRYPEEVTRETDVSDELIEYDLELSYGPIGHPFRLRLSIGGLARLGRLDDVRASGRQGRVMIAGGVRF